MKMSVILSHATETTRDAHIPGPCCLLVRKSAAPEAESAVASLDASVIVLLPSPNMSIAAPTILSVTPEFSADSEPATATVRDTTIGVSLRECQRPAPAAIPRTWHTRQRPRHRNDKTRPEHPTRRSVERFAGYCKVHGQRFRIRPSRQKNMQHAPLPPVLAEWQAAQPRQEVGGRGGLLDRTCGGSERVSLARLTCIPTSRATPAALRPSRSLTK